MKFNFLAVILALSMLFAITGCDPTPTPTPTATQVQPCLDYQLQAALLMSPPDYGMVSSLQPWLTWEYPTSSSPYSYPCPGGSSDCLPTYYRVYLSVFGFPTGPIGNDLGGDTTFTVTGSAGQWQTPQLDPGTWYIWHIQARVSTGSGPYSTTWHFYTPSPCTTLVAPVLLQPGPSELLDYDWPNLVWDYPDECLPDQYLVEVSTNTDVSSPFISVLTNSPATQYAPGGPLNDCITYYWQVTAITGSTYGPVSNIGPFVIDMGSCGGKLLSPSPTTGVPTLEPTHTPSPTTGLPTPEPTYDPPYP
jgi:hypothetical protein